MEIKSKIEENITIQENNISSSSSVKSSGLGNTKVSSFNSDFPDFETYLKDLDKDKKEVCELSPQGEIPKAENPLITNNQEKEALKTLKTLEGKENIPVKINNTDDIRLFLRKKDGLRSFDNDTKINLDKFKKEDIDFFRTCLENPSMALNKLDNQNFQAVFSVQNQNNQVSYKSFDVSKGLFNLMEYSFKAQKPVRLDFNGNSSVILKMNNKGKLIAEFLSNDKAMEYILKSSIPNLKDKLDTEGITYEKISYKDNSENNDKKQRKEKNTNTY